MSSLLPYEITIDMKEFEGSLQNTSVVGCVYGTMVVLA